MGERERGVREREGEMGERGRKRYTERVGGRERERDRETMAEQ